MLQAERICEEMRILHIVHTEKATTIGLPYLTNVKIMQIIVQGFCNSITGNLIKIILTDYDFSLSSFNSRAML